MTHKKKPAFRSINHRALRAWNLYTAGQRDFNIEQARKAQAPQEAIYLGRDGVWHTIEELLPKHPFHAYLKYAVDSGLVP